MELTRRVKETEDVEVVLDYNDIEEIFARAGYPSTTHTPVQALIRSNFTGETAIGGSLDQHGVYLVLRKRRTRQPVFEQNKQVTK